MSMSQPYTLPDSPSDSGAPSPYLLSPTELQHFPDTGPSHSLPNLPTGRGHHSKPQNARSHSTRSISQAGTSSNNPIDLTSSPSPRLTQRALPPSPPPPPPPPPPSLPAPRVDAWSGPVAGTSSSTQQARRRSSYMNTGVPEWQPDNVVKSCPLCHTQFGFVIRRHHCRICGKVVCAKCSPHRITVPSSITVKPPNQTYSESFPAQQALRGVVNNANYGFSLGGPLPSPALDGPEEVRMCKACLQDPVVHNQTSTMGSSLSSTRSGSTTSGGRTPQTSSSNIPTSGRNNRRRPAPEQSGRSVPPNYQPNGLSFVQQQQQGITSLNGIPYTDSPYGDPAAYYYTANGGLAGASATSQGNAFSIPLLPNMQTAGLGFPQFPVPVTMYQQQIPMPNPPTLQPQQVPHQSISRPQSHHLGQLPYPTLQAPLPPLPVQNTTSGSITNPPQRNPVAPRPQLKETDFCPICTQPLPPRDPVTKSEAAREAHIEACISNSLAGSSPSTVQQPNISSSVPTSSITSRTRPQTMPRRSTVSRTNGRMSTYQATEKDTVGPDGEPRECVICFEEFEKGDEMAMLDCLCRYHKVCIKQWFDKKGPGNCPVHYVHEE